MKFLLLLICLIPFAVQSQDKTVTANLVYGQFEMEDMRNWQQSLLQDVRDELGLSFQVTDDFPSYFGGELKFAQEISNKQVGGYINLLSTGGRISYADYSGSYNIDNLIRSIGLGAFVEDKFLDPLPQLGFYIGFMGGINVTDFNIISRFVITDQDSHHSTIKFKSLDISLSPTLTAKYLVHRFLITLGVGYEVRVPGKLTSSGDSDEYLINNSNGAVYADWSGLRLKTGIGFMFN